jgi:hypothetical protein
MAALLGRGFTAADEILDATNVAPHEFAFARERAALGGHPFLPVIRPECPLA